MSDGAAVESKIIGGRYQLETPIGSGGMGTVWRARDQLLRRLVAIKEVRLPDGLPEGERDQVTQRSLREAQAAAGLNHPNVVRVYDVITDEARPWIVMELVTARSLAEILAQDGPLPPRTAAKIGVAMFGALQAAHGAGVLHRDVKPGNVLICTDGRCVLTDFGVARTADQTDLTSPGMVLGSPAYIAPERAAGKDFGPSSDVYSLGVTLYTAVQGASPFDRGDPLSTITAVIQDAPAPPDRAGPLAGLIMALLAKDPAARPTAEQAAQTLRQLLDGPLAGGQPAENPAHSHVTQALPAPGTPPQAFAPPPGFGPPPQGVPAGFGPSQTAAMPLPTSVPGSPVPGPVPHQYAPSQFMPGHAMQPQPGMFGPPAPPPGQLPAQATYPAKTRRLRPFVLAGVALGVVAILLIGGLGLYFGVLKDDPEDYGPGDTTSQQPNFPVRAYTDSRGVTVNVPQDWREQPTKEGTYVDFIEPGETGRWVRINVSKVGAASPENVLGSAERRFASGAGDVANYQRIALGPAELAGLDGAELEYTLVNTKSGQLRHGIWRIAVVDQVSYQVYLSVPDDRFAESKPIFDELVRSFRLA